MTRPADPAAQTTGILLILAAFLVFALTNALAKYLNQRLGVPMGMVVWGRYTFQLPAIASALVGAPVFAALPALRWRMQVFRGLLALAGSAFYHSAIAFIPLAEASAVGYASPIFVTLLSVLALDERVGVRRWSAVGIGFVGVLLVVRPGLGLVHWAAALPLGMAFCFACFQIVTRSLTATEDAKLTLLATALVGSAVMAVAVPFFWAPIGPAAWALLALLGALTAFGHFLMIRAYARALASVVSPFAYSQMLWIILLGYLVFGDFPDRWTLLGAACIIASGLYIFYRETALRRARRDRD